MPLSLPGGTDNPAVPARGLYRGGVVLNREEDSHER